MSTFEILICYPAVAFVSFMVGIVVGTVCNACDEDKRRERDSRVPRNEYLRGKGETL